VLQPETASIRVTSPATTVAGLGKPTKGTFSMRAAFPPPPGGAEAGLFFHGDASEGGPTKSCQAVVIRSDGARNNDGRPTYVLQWLYVELDSGEEGGARKHVWAKARTEIPSNSSCVLNVTLGQTPFPSVVLNDQVIKESSWSLSGETWDNRPADSMSPLQMESIHIGTVGVIVSGAEMEVRGIELRYF
jgi:hypothetical protein